MEEISPNVLVDAKEEYTRQLTRILVPRMYEGISHIYSEAKNLANENENENKTLVIFQNLLKNIPQWNQNIIEKETNRNIEKSGINRLEDLISAIFVIYSKILSAVRVTNHSRIHNFHLTVPKLHHFIHECYIEMARKFYMNTMLFNDELTPNEQQINVRESYKIVKDSIIEAIRILLPVKAILQEYLQASYQEEFGNDKIDISKNKLTERNNENIKNMISRDLNGSKNDEEPDSETDSESDDDDFVNKLQENININTEKENEREMNEIEQTLFADNLPDEVSTELPEELEKKDADENYENEDGISIEIKPKQMDDGIDDNQIKEIKIIDNKKYNDNDTVSNNKEEDNEINTENEDTENKEKNDDTENKERNEDTENKEKNEDTENKEKNEDNKQKEAAELAVKPLEFFDDAQD